MKDKIIQLLGRNGIVMYGLSEKGNVYFLDTNNEWVFYLASPIIPKKEIKEEKES